MDTTSAIGPTALFCRPQHLTTVAAAPDWPGRSAAAAHGHLLASPQHSDSTCQQADRTCAPCSSLSLQARGPEVPQAQV